MILKLFVLLFFIFKLNLSKKIYKGESFPVKYLQSEDLIPDSLDVVYYLQGINKILGHVGQHANETDVNLGLGLLYMKAILKRTIKENNNKIEEEHQKLLKSVIYQAEDIMSHFFYASIKPIYWDDALKRVGELFKEEDFLIEAIGKFNSNRFQKWLFKNLTLNDFQQDMDEINLPKEKYMKYIELSMESKEYTFNMGDSDYCLGEVIYNPRPLDTGAYRSCVAGEYCSSLVYADTHSIGYSLSHRMLNIMFPHHFRRCYFKSLEEDEDLIDLLCSSMYRETVYLARRGYFYRDMWMEHIALCALNGYKEFHRRHWFQKVVSWIDKDGCVAENFNYEANRTRYRLEKETDPEKIKKIREIADSLRTAICYYHQMALSLVVLAHGVRHAVHFSAVDSVKLKYEL